MSPIALVLLALLPHPARAYAPTPELIGSPALLANYLDWSRRSDAFQREGSETEAWRELVEILYDRDIQRPWDASYFPEANKRLSAFRATTCKAAPSVRGCLLPTSLFTDADVKTLEEALLDPASLATLGARWNLSLAPWSRPLAPPTFSLLASVPGTSFHQPLAAWDLQPVTVSFAVLGATLFSDEANYAAGFENQESPALLALAGPGQAALNDWQLRGRSMDFAAAWKHAIGSNHGWSPSNPIADTKELLLQHLYDEAAPDFARVYTEQLALVAATPEALTRFQKARADDDYPEETYQRIAYDRLRELVVLQGTYLSAAAAQRKATSPRQQALESLLTLQRYAGDAAVHTFAIELTTLMEPLTSHAYMLDQVADFPLAQTYTLEMLKALLGLDGYAGKPLFPAQGRGLLAPELFQDWFLTENAPDLKQALGGRDYASLTSDEQLSLLRLYLMPTPGKVRPMGLFRLAAAWLSAAGVDELRSLAERVHEVHNGNFK